MTQTPSSPVAPRPRRVRRFAITGLLILLLLAVLLMLLLPTLLSTGPGTAFALGFVNRSIKGKVAVGDLSLSWMSGVSLRGLEVFDPSGAKALSVKRIEAPGLKLLDILRGDRALGEVKIIDTEASLERGPQGKLNLAAAFEPRQPSAQAAPPGRPLDGLSLKVEMTNARATYVQSGADAVAVTDLYAYLDLPRPEQVFVKVNGLVSQGQTRGTVNLEATVKNLLDAAAQVHLDQAQIDGWASLKDLPTTGLDGMLGQGGRLTALLDDVLNATVAVNGQVKDLTAALTAESPNLDVDLAFTVKDFRFAAKPDSRVKLRLTPQAFRAFFPSDPAELVRRSELVLALKECTGTLRPSGQPDLTSVKAVSVVSLSDVELDAKRDLGVLALRGTRGELSFDGPKRSALALNLEASAQQQGQQGQVKVNLGVLDSLTAEGGLNTDALTLRARAELTDLPVAVADQLARQGDLLREALGPTLSATVTADLRPQGKAVAGTLSLNAKSERATVDLSGKLADKVLTVDPGSMAQLTVTPAWVSRFAPTVKWLEVAAANLLIEEAVLPVDASKLAAAAVRAALTVKSAGVDLGGRVGKLSLTDTKLALQAKGDGKIAATFNSTVASGGLVAQALGASTHVKLESEAPLPADGNFAALVAPFTLTLASPTTTVSLPGRVWAKRLELDPGGTVNLPVTQELLAELGVKDIALAQAAQLGATIEGVSVPLDAGEQQLRSIEAGLSATLDAVALKDVPVSLSGVKVSLPRSKLGGAVTATITGEFRSGEDRGPLRVDATVNDPLASSFTGQASAKLGNVPVALLDALANQGGKLVALLGSRLDTVDASVTMTKGQPWPLGAEVKSAALRTKLAGSFDQATKRVVLNPGGWVEYDLSPSAFATLLPAGSGAVAWTLSGAMPLRLDVTKLEATLPRQGQKFDVRAASVNVLLTSKGGVFERAGAKLPVNNLSLTVNATRPAESVTLDLAATAGEGQPLRSLTTLRNLLNDQGAVDIATLTLETDTQAPQLPVELIDQVTGMQGKLVGVLSPSANVNAKGEFPGDLDVSVASDTANLAALVNADAQRTVTLRQDITGDLKVTPELSKALLQYWSPVLADASGSKEPIKMRVAKETFKLPLKDFDVKNLAADVEMELGMVTLDKSWLLQSLAGELGKLGAKLGSTDKVTARFTKLQVSMKEGVVRTNDLWLTGDQMFVGTQGTVDLNQQRADLLIGLTGRSLAMIPGMDKLAGSTTLYEFPARGPLNAIKPDWGEFFRNILDAQLKQRLLGNLGQGGQAIVGALDALGRTLEPKRLQGQWPNRPEDYLAPFPETPEGQGRTPSDPAASPTQPRPQPAQPQPEQPPPAKDPNPIDVLEGLLRGRQKK